MNNKLITVLFTLTLAAGSTAFGMHRGGRHHGHGHRGWRHYHGQHHGMHQQHNNNNNINDPATTPNPAYMLQFACMSNDQGTIFALLQRPDVADFINAINDFSQTALDITQAKLNLVLEQALKDKGGQTAVEVFAAAPNPGELLRRACKLTNKAQVQALLARADVAIFIDEKGKRGMTALQIATHQGNQEIVQLLTAAGAVTLAPQPTFVHVPHHHGGGHHGHKYSHGWHKRGGCW